MLYYAFCVIEFKTQIIQLLLFSVFWNAILMTSSWWRTNKKQIIGDIVNINFILVTHGAANVLMVKTQWCMLFGSASFLRKKWTISHWKCIKFGTWVFYDILTKKFNKTFLLKFDTKTHDAFSMRNSSFFPKNEALRSESVNIFGNEVYVCYVPSLIYSE